METSRRPGPAGAGTVIGARFDLRLETPSLALADSYRSLVAEFTEGGEELIPFPLGFAHVDFPAFLNRMAANARGEGLPEGFVANSTYWLVLGGADVVGVSNLRHQLTEALMREGGNIGYGVRPSARRRGFATELLRGTLERARALGLERVLLTCDRDNEPSSLTILRNGGVLSSEEFLPELGRVVQRYWIDTSPAYPAHRAIPLPTDSG